MRALNWMVRGCAVAAIILSVLGSVARAQLIAYEPFNYPPGDLNGGTPTTATGFAGTWSRLIALSADYGAVTAGSLSYPDLPTSDNKLENGHNILGAALDTSIAGPFAAYRDANGNIGLDGTTLYMSVLLKQSVTNHNFTAFDIFRDSIDDANRRASIDIWTGHGDASQYYVSGWAPTNILVTAAPVGGGPVTSTNLFVLKFTFGLGNNDTLAVYTNPTVGSPEPGSPTGSISGLDLSFDMVGTAHFSNGFITADEIRVGGNFASVVPAPTVVPEPSALAGAVLGIAGCLLRRRR
jgi:hypothetical protein